jgi:methionyl-tRNA formyltransferase
MSRFRIVFMGTPEFACPTLQALVDRGEEVVAVVTQPDRPKGRGQQLAPPPVKELAQRHGIPVLQPVKVRQPEVVEQLKELAPDLIVVVAFGQILPKSVLEIPRHGCINIHASLLPRWRGAAPINWCLIGGDTETGVTTMQMDVGLDTGDMLVKRTIPIGPDDDARTLHDKLSLLGAEALGETLDLLAAGRLVAEKQDDALTCYAAMLKKEDGELDWSRPATELRNRIRGMNPWPGTFTFWDGKLVKVFRGGEGAGSGQPGTVLRAGRDGIEVACGSGSLVLAELQLEGKKRLPAAEFLAGCRLEPGTVLGGSSA